MILKPPLKYPFEKTVTDLFDLSGHTSIAYADRFSGELEVERLPSSAFIHQSSLDISVIMGCQKKYLMMDVYLSMLKNTNVSRKIGDVNHRLSSVAYPKSN